MYGNGYCTNRTTKITRKIIAPEISSTSKIKSSKGNDTLRKQSWKCSLRNRLARLGATENLYHLFTDDFFGIWACLAILTCTQLYTC